MSEVHYFPGQRKNSLLLVHGNFIYNLLRKDGNNKRWRCRNRKCSGQIVINGEDKVVLLINHNCIPITESEISALKIKKKIRDVARNSANRPSVLVNNIIKDYDDETISKLPANKSLNYIVSRERLNGIEDFSPSIPDFPLSLHNNLRGELFFRFDSGLNEVNRFVIFFSDFQKSIICKTKMWLIDGTFKSVPCHFNQLITIHAKFMGKFYPLVHILMKNKTENIYKLAFLKIKELIKFEPNVIIIDFEKALKNSLHICYNSSKIYGCNFHFGQMFWRRIQLEGLIYQYKEFGTLRNSLRKLLILPFIPKNLIASEFDNIKDEILIQNNEQNMKNFLSYFEKMFIGNTEKEAVYCNEFWSCFERVIDSIDRTTNVLEAWHRSLYFFSHSTPKYCNVSTNIIK